MSDTMSQTGSQTGISSKNLLIALQPVLKQHLQAPRPMAVQTQQQLANTYQCHDEVSENKFLRGELETPEPILPYEWDMLLSPSYTPSKEERLRYQLPMGLGHCTPFTLQQLIGYVVNSGLEGCLVRPDGSQIRFKLPETVIETFITRLGLQKPLCRETGYLLMSHEGWSQLNAIDQQLCLLSLRQDIWQKTEQRKTLLRESFLPRILQQSTSQWAVLLDTLTSIATTYRPKSLEAFVKQLLSLKDSCEKDLDQVTTRGFHHDEIKARYQDDDIIKRLGQSSVKTQYQRWIDQTDLLLGVFQSL
jgi:hypothetical protein